MKPFLVLAPGGFISEPGIDISIRSFASLYHNVTPKHKRRLILTIIEKEDQIPKLRKRLEEEDLRSAVNIIRRQDVEAVKTAYRDASLFLYPTTVYSYKIIPEALSFALPVLTFEHQDVKDILDNTCSMLVAQSRYDRQAEFSKLLEMLYFDPEVRKILSRGAKLKYEKDLNWGRKSREKEDVPIRKVG